MGLISLAVLLLFGPVTYPQSRPSVAIPADRVVILPRTVTLVRRASQIKGFPEKRTAKITYPAISGVQRPPVLRRIQSLLRVKNVFDSSIEEYKQDTWLEEFGYAVNYNKNHILDITFTQTGSGAYPDTHTKHFAINLKNGSVIKASDVFVNDKLSSLASLVNSRLQAELKKTLESLTESGSDPEDTRIASEAQAALEFKLENLDEFSVGDKGITFLYDAGYPHAIQAFEPEGRYFFSYSEMKPYIKPDGLLGQFID